LTLVVYEKQPITYHTGTQLAST